MDVVVHTDQIVTAEQPRCEHLQLGDVAPFVITVTDGRMVLGRKAYCVQCHATLHL